MPLAGKSAHLYPLRCQYTAKTRSVGFQSRGALRRNYAIRSADYGEMVASGVVRYGTTPWLTLEGRGDIAKEMHVIGVALIFAWGYWVS